MVIILVKEVIVVGLLVFFLYKIFFEFKLIVKVCLVEVLKDLVEMVGIKKM